MSDLISRADAREAIEKLMDIHFDRQVVLAKARDAIVWLPSADRPTGEWEMCKDDDGIYGVCSICGRDADFSHYGIPYKFCPNCGAIMRGDSE